MKKYSIYNKISIAVLSVLTLAAVTARGDSGAATMVANAPVPGEASRVIKANNVNVRSRPSTTAEVVAQLKKGDKIEVSETKTVTEGAKSREWLRIALPATAKCFVSSKLLKEGVATADAINVRCGPGASFKDIGKLAKDEKVEIIKAEGEWTQIRPTAQCFGWVAAEFVETVPAIAPAPPVITTTEVVTPTVTVTNTITQTVEREIPVQASYVVRYGVFQTVRADEPAEGKHLTQYELLTESVERRQYRIAYLETTEKDLQKFEGKYVRVAGNWRWRQGDRYPVIVVERLENAW